MKNYLIALKLFLVVTILTGLLYPVLITIIAQTAFRDQANGSLSYYKGNVVGSILIGQKFDKEKYFWPRPSAVDYNPLPSGGSNLSSTSKILKDLVSERMNKLVSADRVKSGGIPSDLLFASGSGLDPHISPASAMLQVGRIAKARGIDKNNIIDLINGSIEKRDLLVFGEPRVNVLRLNESLDNIGKAGMNK